MQVNVPLENELLPVNVATTVVPPPDVIVTVPSVGLFQVPGKLPPLPEPPLPLDVNVPVTDVGVPPPFGIRVPPNVVPTLLPLIKTMIMMIVPDPPLLT